MEKEVKRIEGLNISFVTEDEALAEIEALGVIVPESRILKGLNGGYPLLYGGVTYVKPEKLAERLRDKTDGTGY